ncbi:hypothetical protein [Pontibacter sp. G13]|uniref:hypothetical protein n=1 Tax=Pontibacter sp. G13 TaxID=3074898 RepID=UPI00288AEC3E|nr:hypothetical protein [Pontibacter sp. G13]WNJ18680.1 hypothetical protein RJD25_27810 [Pontibacter sp. G13]
MSVALSWQEKWESREQAAPTDGHYARSDTTDSPTIEALENGGSQKNVNSKAFLSSRMADFGEVIWDGSLKILEK